MKIKSIHHITINLKDEKKTADFYGKLLELKRLPDVDMGDHRLIYFELPGNVRLEFIDYYEKDRCGMAIAPSNTPGSARHFAFEVEDAFLAQKKMEEYGLEIVSAAKKVEELSFIGFLAKEPNGFELEFIQRI